MARNVPPDTTTVCLDMDVDAYDFFKIAAKVFRISRRELLNDLIYRFAHTEEGKYVIENVHLAYKPSVTDDMRKVRKSIDNKRYNERHKEELRIKRMKRHQSRAE